MSLARTLRNIRKAGFKQYWHNLNYIGDAKVGTLVGTDNLGNKYYENLDEQPGRHRWVDFAAHDFNVAQVEPVWHSWLQHIRQDPPTQDPIVQASRKTWEVVSVYFICVRRPRFPSPLDPYSIGSLDRISCPAFSHFIWNLKVNFRGEGICGKRGTILSIWLFVSAKVIL